MAACFTAARLSASRRGHASCTPTQAVQHAVNPKQRARRGSAQLLVRVTAVAQRAETVVTEAPPTPAAAAALPGWLLDPWHPLRCVTAKEHQQRATLLPMPSCLCRFGEGWEQQPASHWPMAKMGIWFRGGPQVDQVRPRQPQPSQKQQPDGLMMIWACHFACPGRPQRTHAANPLMPTAIPTLSASVIGPLCCSYGSAVAANNTSHKC